MKARMKERFSLSYKGKVEVFDKNAIVEGWPAKRAIAAGKAVPYKPRKRKSPETKVVSPAEVKDGIETT